jgi:hypothetical protein
MLRLKNIIAEKICQITAILAEKYRAVGFQAKFHFSAVALTEPLNFFFWGGGSTPPSSSALR